MYPIKWTCEKGIKSYKVDRHMVKGNKLIKLLVSYNF